jgi:hypothetical protein
MMSLDAQERITVRRIGGNLAISGSGSEADIQIWKFKGVKLGKKGFT